jgi:hypothetical protein
MNCAVSGDCRKGPVTSETLLLTQFVDETHVN